MIRKLIYASCLFLTTIFNIHAQCSLAVNEVDPFDSTRLISSSPIHIGHFIPSLLETVQGPKIIEEAEWMFSFSQSDRPERINAFFMTIAAAEYKYQPIEEGLNVLLALEDSTVVALHNFPDKGTFDKSTNMRIYQHTAVVPVDTYYRLSQLKIIGIRIRYQNKKRSFFLLPEQQEAIQEAIRCVGKTAGFNITP
jgi:hypothetical protein